MTGDLAATAPARRARLLIVDDHALARAGLKYVLECDAGLEVVGEAASGREALTLCRRLHPDLVLMDVRMPDMDGLTATRHIKQHCPGASVIIVTLYENPEYLAEALKAGAVGYLLKDATPREIVSAVRQALRGELPLSRQLLTQLVQRVTAGTGDLDRPGVAALTPRERQVLTLLARGQTNKEIARALMIGSGTVKSHVQRIIAKLGVADRTQAAVQAVRTGLISAEG